MARRKGLNAKDHKTMLALIKQRKSKKVVAAWLMVDESYVAEYMPKRKTKKKE